VPLAPKLPSESSLPRIVREIRDRRQPEGTPRQISWCSTERGPPRCRPVQSCRGCNAQTVLGRVLLQGEFQCGRGSCTGMVLRRCLLQAPNQCLHNRGTEQALSLPTQKSFRNCPAYLKNQILPGARRINAAHHNTTKSKMQSLTRQNSQFFRK